jgi:hypothetical protein
MKIGAGLLRMLLFAAGVACGVVGAQLWESADRAELRRELAKSRQYCDDWRDLAVLRDEELQAAYKELAK